MAIELWNVLDENGNATGRFHERGKLMNNNEYHLEVSVWIENDNGEYLISQRSPNKTFPNMWECTGGNAVAGDDSLTTALKEAKEELGIILDPRNGRIIKQHLPCSTVECQGLIDVWFFRQNIDISTVILDPDETCDAMWASRKKIKQMIDDGIFISVWHSYLDELFLYCDTHDIPGYNTFVKIEPIEKGWSEDKKYYVETADGQRMLLRISDVSEFDRKKAEYGMMERVYKLGIITSQPFGFGLCDGGKSVYSLSGWLDGEDAEKTLPFMSETEQNEKVIICDIDLYQKSPFQNAGNLGIVGSARYVSPEECIPDAVMDEVTNVYTMGATAFALFAYGDRSPEAWLLNKGLYDVAKRAVNDDRSQRQPSIEQFITEWRAVK